MIIDESQKDCMYLPQGYRMPKNMFCAWMFVAVSIPNLVFFNIFYVTIYLVELPFFEQYKVEKDKPWPWKANYDDWIDKLFKAIRLVIFNNLVTVGFRAK